MKNPIGTNIYVMLFLLVLFPLFSCSKAFSALEQEIDYSGKTMEFNLNTPKEIPKIEVSNEEIGGILSGVRQIFSSGIKICRDIAKSVLSSIFPDITLPDWVFFALGSSIFSLILSSFVSIPIGIIAFILLASGYIWW